MLPTLPKTAKALTRAGFSIRAASHVVQCKDCGLQLDDRLQLQQALKLHISRKPGCRFVSSHYGRCSTHPPKHPRYQSISSRIESFQCWPSKYVPQSPETLAAAGFFYIGSADRTTCFHCGVTLRDWTKEDDAVTMHRQNSKECEFINQPDLIQLGVEPRPLPGDTVSDFSNPDTDLDTDLPEETESDIVTDMACGTTASRAAGGTVYGAWHGDIVTDSVKHTDSDRSLYADRISNSNNNTVVQLVMNMGFSLTEITRAQKQLAQTNPMGCHDVSELVATIVTFEMQELNTETIDTSSSNSSPDCLIWPEGERGVRGTSAGSIHTPSDTTTGVASRKHLRLKMENRRLRNQKTCHVCGLSDVSVLFLPCGHLITCEVCAPRVKTCLTCNKAILGTVKTYLT